MDISPLTFREPVSKPESCSVGIAGWCHLKGQEQIAAWQMQSEDKVRVQTFTETMTPGGRHAILSLRACAWP